MECNLIHLVPFDTGYSFMNYDFEGEKFRERFCSLFFSFLQSNGFEYYVGSTGFPINVKCSSTLECRILESGIGVFIIKNLKSAYTNKAEDFFKDSMACRIYYEKKMSQKMILNGKLPESKIIYRMLKEIWSIGKAERIFSSSSSYKHYGLSYVLTIYHIIDDNLESDETKQIDMLMHPSILGEITSENKWETIRERIGTYKNVGLTDYEKPFNEKSKIIATWSAVAVLETEPTEAINQIVNYEVNLQASWFLCDAIIDNIEKTRHGNLELQRQKNLVSSVYLDTMNIISANMTTAQKNAMEIIYNTSGLETMKTKCSLLLDNRIAIENTIISNKQVKYGIITEILLLAMALLQIYEPIKNFFSGNLSKGDVYTIVIMLIVLLFSSYFIIKKDK